MAGTNRHDGRAPKRPRPFRSREHRAYGSRADHFHRKRIALQPPCNRQPLPLCRATIPAPHSVPPLPLRADSRNVHRATVHRTTDRSGAPVNRSTFLSPLSPPDAPHSTARSETAGHPQNRTSSTASSLCRSTLPPCFPPYAAHPTRRTPRSYGNKTGHPQSRTHRCTRPTWHIGQSRAAKRPAISSAKTGRLVGLDILSRRQGTLFYSFCAIFVQ